MCRFGVECIDDWLLKIHNPISKLQAAKLFIYRFPFPFPMFCFFFDFPWKRSPPEVHCLFARNVLFYSKHLRIVFVFYIGWISCEPSVNEYKQLESNAFWFRLFNAKTKLPMSIVPISNQFFHIICQLIINNQIRMIFFHKN